MTQPVDWADQGILILQDHEEDGPAVGMRRMIVGGRFAGYGDEDGLPEWETEDEMGTLGDVHPWRFWQTESRDKRDMGSWAQVFAAIVTDGGTTQTPRGPISGTPAGSPPARGPADAVAPGLSRSLPGSAQGGPAPCGNEGTGEGGGIRILPIRTDDYDADDRYKQVENSLPPGTPRPPQGAMVLALAGTEESEQENLVFTGSMMSPLVAVNKNPSADMGTLVYDLEPADTIAKNRCARLQSAWRVVLFEDTLDGVPKGRGSGLAIQLTASGQDGLAGYGAMIGRGDAAGSGEQENPPQTTPSEQDRGVQPGLLGGSVGPGNVAGSSYEVDPRHRPNASSSGGRS